MIRAIALCALLVGCAGGPSATSQVSKKELNTYKKWACSKCETLKNKTSLKACRMVCQKDGY